MKNTESIIQCRTCGSKRFELRLFADLDGSRSIVAYCDCGRVVEYIGVQDAIELTKGVN